MKNILGLLKIYSRTTIDFQLAKLADYGQLLLKIGFY